MTAQPTHQHVVTRCHFCTWQHEGALEDGLAAHRIHRVVAHGITVEPKKRKGRSPWSSNVPLADNIANARAQGAARWHDGKETL